MIKFRDEEIILPKISTMTKSRQRPNTKTFCILGTNVCNGEWDKILQALNYVHIFKENNIIL